ncbi:MAG: hypothetical protein NXH95_13585 [Pseudomonadaceae bacterium]|nr:hypothetical protein [Pseudomonadaceae bacterium]
MNRARPCNGFADEERTAYCAARNAFARKLTFTPPGPIYYHGSFDCQAVADAVAQTYEIPETYDQYTHEALWMRFEAEFRARWDAYQGQPALIPAQEMPF